jgi:uncharacterized protein (DUF885 family)
MPVIPSFSSAVDEYLNGSWKRNPVQATAVGVHDYDTELGDFSASAIKEDVGWMRQQLSRFESLDPSSLSADDAEELRLVVAMIRTQLMYMEDVKILNTNPVAYPELCIYGCYLPCVREYAPMEERLHSVVKRLQAVPRVLNDAKTNLKNPPRTWTELALETSQGAAMFLKGALPPLFGRVPHLRKDFEASSAGALSALAEYSRFLSDDLMSRSAGAYAIGRDLFDFLLREDHMLEMDSDSLLAFGEDWVARAERDLSEMGRSIDASAGWPDIAERYKNDHPQAAELLSFYEGKVQMAKQFIMDNGLVALPKDESLAVVPTPDFEKAFLPYAAYMPPAPFEKEQKGLFFVTLVDESLPDEGKEQQLKGHNRYKATITALHEAYPGHHLQFTKANAHRSKVRKLYGNNVFVEGWALYCEEMMYEEGFYPDAITRLFQLKDTLWRACRVVLDVKLHLGTMSFEDACEFLCKKAGLERINAQKEVSRYTLSPTQPMSYLVGREEIMALRERVKTEQGGSFSLSRFHDWLLSHGAVPVGLIAASRELS